MHRILVILCSLLVSAASMAQSEQLWGYNTDNTFKSTGWEDPGDYDVAMRVPASLAGRRIVAFNLPVRTPRMARLKLWGGTTSLGDKSIFQQDCSSVTLPHIEYIRIPLEQPITVPADGMFVGYSFSIESIVDAIDDTHPIGVRSDMPLVPGSFYVAYSVYGGNWDDMSDQRVSALQLFLSTEQTAQNALTVSSVTAPSVLAGQEATVSVTVDNVGSQPVTEIVYELSCGEDAVQGQYSLTTDYPGGLTGRGTISLTAPTAPTAGLQPGYVKILQVNRKPNEAQDKTSAEFTVPTISRQVARRTVVEEVTGTGCGFCTSGYVMMEQIRSTMPQVLGICLHWFNNYSPMYVADYDTTFPQSRAPLCTVDRKTTLFDPYFGLDGRNAAAWANTLNADLPEADLNLTATYTGIEGSEVHTTANVELLTDLPDAYLAFVLTADGLTGSSARWAQTNYYALESPATYPGLADFCAGGKYGESNVFLTYNDVMVASSWRTDNQRHAPALTSQRAGHTQSIDYTLRLPSEPALRAAIQANLLSVTAMVIKADGTIANAARCNVNVPDGITQTSLSNSSTPATNTFDLQGRPATPARGIYLQQGRKLIR